MVNTTNRHRSFCGNCQDYTWHIYDFEHYPKESVTTVTCEKCGTQNVQTKPWSQK